MNDIPRKLCNQCGESLTNHRCYTYSNGEIKKPSNFRDRFNEEWENVVYKLDHALDYPTEAAREQLWIFFNQELLTTKLELIDYILEEVIDKDEDPGDKNISLTSSYFRTVARNQLRAIQRAKLTTMKEA